MRSQKEPKYAMNAKLFLTQYRNSVHTCTFVCNKINQLATICFESKEKKRNPQSVGLRLTIKKSYKKNSFKIHY